METEIRSSAEANWGTDYQMIDYEINLQTDSYNTLKGMKLDEVQSGIMNEAWGNWHYDFQMVEYEYNL